jgi:hypothetical chaperone protein
VKAGLSAEDRGTFEFKDGVISIERNIRREQFENWIQEYLAKIEGCVHRLLSSAAIDASDVDQVFLTGGSSLVPAVRRIFESRFGKERIRGGSEFTSVAKGLALRGLLWNARS